MYLSQTYQESNWGHPTTLAHFCYISQKYIWFDCLFMLAAHKYEEIKSVLIYNTDNYRWMCEKAF